MADSPSLPADGSPCESAPTFEQALARLEGIVRELEEGQLGLAEALARYEQGMAFLTQCQGLLDRAERKIELLTGVDAQGRPITTPFAESAATSLEEKAATRGRRRSAATGPTNGGGDSALFD